MKAVFAHDHIFKEDIEGNYYTGACYNNTVWRRYLRNFDELTVLARLDSKKVPLNNKYNKFKLNNLSFQPLPSLSGPVNIVKNRSRVKKVIYNELMKSDVLIARLPSEIGNLAIEMAKKLGKPYLIEVVGCVWDSLWNYGNLQAKVYAPIAFQRMKNIVKDAEYVIYVTNDFLQKRYPTNGITESISNVEIEEVDKQVLQKRIEKYSLNKKKPIVIGMIGSLQNKIKGLDIALKALKELKKDNINFSFKVLGDGDSEEWLNFAKELNIEDRVEFCGVLPGGEPVLQWLDTIDLYIQPSYQEGLPRAVIEAMSRGCPVIGSTAGGIPELINSNCLHKPGDFETLAEIIKNIATNTETMEALSKENFETSKRYKKTVLDTKRYEFIDSVLKEKKLL